MLLFLTLVAAFTSVEFRRYPRISHLNRATIKMRKDGFAIKGLDVQLTDTHTDRDVFGLHDVFEGCGLESLEYSKAVRKAEDNTYLLSGLETPISDVGITALFYHSIFETNKIGSGPLVLSYRDYSTDEPVRKALQIFRSIGASFRPTTAPESVLAACFHASLCAEDCDKEVCIVNYSGAKAVRSVFDISVKTKDGKVTREIKQKEFVVYNDKDEAESRVLADADIEKAIIGVIKRAIKKKIKTAVVAADMSIEKPTNLTFLPYERAGVWYTDISKCVAKIRNQINMPAIEVSMVTEQICYKDVDGKPHPFVLTEIAVPLDGLRKKLATMAIAFKAAPKNAEAVYISDYVIEDGSQLDIKYTKMNDVAIGAGMKLYRTEGYTVHMLNGPVEAADSSVEPTYKNVMQEINTRKQCISIASDLETKLKSFSKLVEKDFAEIRSLIEKRDDGKAKEEPVNFDTYSYTTAQKITAAFESLGTAQADIVRRLHQIEDAAVGFRGIENQVDMYAKQPEFANAVQAMKDARAWYDAGKDALSPKEIKDKTRLLTMEYHKALRVYNARLDAEFRKAEEARKEKEEAEKKEKEKKAAEENKDDQDKPERAEAHTSNQEEAVENTDKEEIIEDEESGNKESYTEAGDSLELEPATNEEQKKPFEGKKFDKDFAKILEKLQKQFPGNDGKPGFTFEGLEEELEKASRNKSKDEERVL